MPLRRLPLPAEEPVLPGDVRRFLREADRRIERFQRARWAPGFVASDYARVYAGLCRIEAPGRCFCEWGSGFGVVCCLAAMLGFDTWGIEIRQELVDASRELAGDFDVPAELALGSFVPPGAYAQIGLDIADFDLIFAYSWPDEEAAIANLFHRHARPGALLLTYHGGADVRLRKKASRRSA